MHESRFKYLNELKYILFQVKAVDKLSQCGEYSATSLPGWAINISTMQRQRNKLHMQIITIIVPKYLESQFDEFFPFFIHTISINLYQEQEIEELES